MNDCWENLLASFPEEGRYLRGILDQIREREINSILSDSNFHLDKYTKCKEMLEKINLNNYLNTDEVSEVDFWMKVWKAILYKSLKEKIEKSAKLGDKENNFMEEVESQTNECKILEALYKIKIFWSISEMDRASRFQALIGTGSTDTVLWFIKFSDFVDTANWLISSTDFNNRFFSDRVLPTILYKFWEEDLQNYFFGRKEVCEVRNMHEFLGGFRKIAEEEERRSRRWEISEDVREKLEKIKELLGVTINEEKLKDAEKKLEEMNQKKRQLEDMLEAITRKKEELESEIVRMKTTSEEEKRRSALRVKELEDEMNGIRGELNGIRAEYERILAEKEEKEQEIESIKLKNMKLEERMRLEEEAKSRGCYAGLSDVHIQEMIFENVVKSNLANKTFPVYWQGRMNEFRCRLKPWDILEERRPDWQPGEPKNIVLTATLNDNILSQIAGKPKVIVRAYFRTRPKVLRDMGFDYKPMGRFVRAIIDKERENAEKGNYVCVLCIASPTGFDEESQKLVKDYSNQYCTPFLINTKNDEIYYNTMAPLSQFSPLFQKESMFDAAYRVSSEIEEILLRYPEGMVSKRLLRIALGSDLSVVDEAIKLLSAAGKIDVLMWSDKVGGKELGDVVKRRR